MNSSYKELWKKMVPPGFTEAETDFIEDVSSLNKGQKVLDIMCGFGRHSIALAKRGYKITAIDSLRDYIEEIKETASNKNLAIESILGDVAVVKYADTFDAIICMGNSFASFDEQNATNVLQSLSSSIKTGGVFIINSWMIGEIAIKHFQEKTWLYVDRSKYLLDNKFLFHPTRIETDHILISDDGKIETLKGVDYIFTFAELEALLQQAGFEMLEVYATPRKRKYQFGDNQAYIVAVKK